MVYGRYGVWLWMSCLGLPHTLCSGIGYFRQSVINPGRIRVSVLREPFSQLNNQIVHFPMHYFQSSTGPAKEELLCHRIRQIKHSSVSNSFTIISLLAKDNCLVTETVEMIIPGKQNPNCQLGWEVQQIQYLSSKISFDPIQTGPRGPTLPNNGAVKSKGI